MILKRVGILSIAKFSAIVSLIIGLIMGIIFGFASQIAASLIGLSQTSNTLSIWFISIIVIPVLFSILFTILVVFISAIYNLLSQLFGGINLEFETQTLVN